MSLVCARCGQENPDGFRFCGACGASLIEAPAPREVRKTVTVLFADVVGSTAQGEQRDPEAIRAQMSRWFEEARTILERHGGRVEKFVGDAVMAVFGVPQSHEDDALRAVRAASELRSGSIRIGVNTGEVVTGEGETLVTGDAVNVAARLEQSAGPGEILIGAETRRLVRDAIECEPVAPLELKGKSAPVDAYRLLGVDPDAAGVTRHLDAPLIGRARELARLHEDFARAVADRTCQLFTLLGSAGVGKSRLAAEFLAGVDALTLHGRCLHYGEGITYFPLVEVLIQLGVDPESVIASSPAETQLAFRKLLETRASQRPVVVVFDDIQWAEPTFLDLIEHVADLSRGAPMLLLCIARPELLDSRQAWGGGKLNATTILLEPLGEEECDRLIASLGGVDESTRARIVASSQGNPLFVEEMLAMLHENGDVTVPATIHALLQARLDGLGRDERSVIERGAVEGQVFHRGALIELAPGADVDRQLPSLVRKELIRPDAATFPDEEAYRFRHLLIRDAAYDALPKETRAELHERFAGWLEAQRHQLVEHDEIVGYHLEQAALYRSELGEPDEALAARAAELLLAAGRRAMSRGDASAASGLLTRASDLLPAGERDETLLELAPAMLLRGEFDRLKTVLEELRAGPDPRSRAYATLLEIELWMGVEPALVVSRGEAAAAGAQAVFASLGDERGLARVAQARFTIAWMQSKSIPAHEALLDMREHARRSGDTSAVRSSFLRGFGVFMFGRPPVADILSEVEGRRAAAEESPVVRAGSLNMKGFALGLQGRFAEGLETMEEGNAIMRELGMHVLYATRAHGSAPIKWFAGDPAGAVDDLRQSVRALEELGEHGFRSTSLAHLAQALYAVGDPEGAVQAALESEQISAPDDYINFALSRSARALVLADRGELGEAEEVARSAVEYAFRTDFPLIRGDALAALSNVLRRAGRDAEAQDALEQAVKLYEAKGAEACVGRLYELAGSSL